MQANWYQIQNIDELDSSALVIYPERVKANIDTFKKMIDDPQRLRPHAKTHKNKEVTQLLMAAGINKFKFRVQLTTTFIFTHELRIRKLILRILVKHLHV